MYWTIVKEHAYNQARKMPYARADKMMRDINQLEQDFIQGYSLLATDSPKFRCKAYAAMAVAHFPKKCKAVLKTEPVPDDPLSGEPPTDPGFFTQQIPEAPATPVHTDTDPVITPWDTEPSRAQGSAVSRVRSNVEEHTRNFQHALDDIIRSPSPAPSSHHEYASLPDNVSQHDSSYQAGLNSNQGYE